MAYMWHVFFVICSKSNHFAARPYHIAALPCYIIAAYYYLSFRSDFNLSIIYGMGDFESFFMSWTTRVLQKCAFSALGLR